MWDRTGLFKSSIHRYLQAMDRRDRYPESSCWDMEADRAWLIRLVVVALFVCGFKRGVGTGALSCSGVTVLPLPCQYNIG